MPRTPKQSVSEPPIPDGRTVIVDSDGVSRPVVQSVQILAEMSAVELEADERGERGVSF